MNKAIAFVLDELKNQGKDVESIINAIDSIQEQIDKLKISHFGKKKFPPKGH